MMSVGLLQDKNIIVTGASSGLGRHIAVECSNEMANVLLIGRRTQELEKTLKLMQKGKHQITAFDVTDFDKIEEKVESFVKSTGQVSGFVHCAGVEGTFPLNSMKKEIYDKFFNTNVIAAFEFSRIISKKKYCNPLGASFVFLASVMGSLGQPGKVAYCASKGALISGSKALALELTAKKIRVNCVSPSMVETEMASELFNSLPDEAVKTIRDMHPLGFGKPQDISNLCTFLLSDKATWITGANLVIDGGYSSK